MARISSFRTSSIRSTPKFNKMPSTSKGTKINTTTKTTSKQNAKTDVKTKNTTTTENKTTTTQKTIGTPTPIVKNYTTVTHSSNDSWFPTWLLLWSSNNNNHNNCGNNCNGNHVQNNSSGIKQETKQIVNSQEQYEDEGLSFCEWALLLTIVFTAAYWIYKKIYKDTEI